MCFRRLDLSKAEVAKVDIVVWKVFDKISKDKYSSPHMGHEVVKHQEISTKGFSYGQDKQDVFKGIHSYTTSHNADSSGWSCTYGSILRCIIPKGTRYYKNNTECVSTRLIVGGRKRRKTKNVIKGKPKVARR